MPLRPIATCLLFALCVACCDASVVAPRWFGDNMVLQTNAEYGARAFLSGRASPGERVQVAFSPSESHFGSNYSTRADAKGDWEVQLYPSSSAAACSITIKGETGPSITARNVLFGDVFFCSGQSNMVFPLSLANNASAEAATLSMLPYFRFFMTGRDYADTPQWDLAAEPKGCEAAGGRCNQWLTSEAALRPSANGTASFVSSFSAVCFLTARDLAKLHLGKRPVGLVQSAWGGTRVEAWMSPAALAATPFAKNVPVGKEQNAATVLYNAMVAPWNRFAVRAAFWYQ